MCQRVTERDAYEAPETCDCGDCMPSGADGAMEDALDAAMAKLARIGVRGRYEVKPGARTVAIAWRGEGSRTDVDREALREAAHCLRRAGCGATLAPGMSTLIAA